MSTLEEWTAAVCADLGLDPASADTKTVLDLARDVAHGIGLAADLPPDGAHRVYNVATGVGTTFRELADVVVEEILNLLRA